MMSSVASRTTTGTGGYSHRLSCAGSHEQAKLGLDLGLNQFWVTSRFDFHTPMSMFILHA